MNTQRVEGHTPTPWKLWSGGEEGHILSIYSKREDDVIHWSGFDNAVLSEKEKLRVTKANAAFIVHACNNIERLEKVNEALVTELMAANAQMESAAECIEKGRYDEALLHVRSMSGKRAEVIRLAKEPA